jgi:hypothetical protein
MHHGRGVDNPVSQVMFYSKRYPNGEQTLYGMLPPLLICPSVCQRAEKEDVSLLMPEKFGEILIQVYTKEERFMGLVQAAYRHVFTSVPIPDAQSETATIVATPPSTEAPSTPRPLARTPLGVPSAQPSGSFGRTPSRFTTIPPDCQSRSPSMMASRSLKRSREASVELDIDHSPPKRKSLRLAAAGTTK